MSLMPDRTYGAAEVVDRVEGRNLGGTRRGCHGLGFAGMGLTGKYSVLGSWGPSDTIEPHAGPTVDIDTGSLKA